MRAAIYARRSTDEHQEASLDVQLGEARRFIASKGWTLCDDHIFQDDAKSRAEFKKRPALIAMLNAAEVKAFDAVVVRDESRLGGDMNRTCLLIQDLLDAGVQLFYYYSGEEVRLEGATAKMMMALRNFASELEREKVSQRTHEHLLTKARQGLNVGGRVYGYDNIEVMTEGAEKRSRVEYRINEAQAEVIREIFRAYAAGDGLRTIAKNLNGRGVPRPRVGKRGTGSWAPASLYSMLRNTKYRGRFVWNKTEKMYRKGTKVREDRPEKEWQPVEMPELRIVDDDLWQAVERRTTGARLPHEPRPKKGRPYRNLLSGIATCAGCGGPLHVVNDKHGRSRRRSYACAYHRDRGETVCRVSGKVQVESLEGAICEWIVENVLHEEIVADLMAEVRRSLAGRAVDQTPQITAWEDEAKQLRKELDRLVTALATMDDKPDAIVMGITERQARLSELKARIEVARATPAAVGAELLRVEHEAKARILRMREALTADALQGWEVLKALLDGPLRVSFEEGVGAIVEGSTLIGRLLGTSQQPPNLASPTACVALGGYAFPSPRLYVVTPTYLKAA